MAVKMHDKNKELNSVKKVLHINIPTHKGRYIIIYVRRSRQGNEIEIYFMT